MPTAPAIEHDRDIANAWRYRDYVIKAFNQDKPYDRFILEQLAGDELAEIGTTTASLPRPTIASGPGCASARRTIPTTGTNTWTTIIRTTFQGFMGLSVNCARCHDHKFDPITRMDYYRSMAMLFGYVDYDHPLAPPEQSRRIREDPRRKLKSRSGRLARKISLIEAPYRKAAFEKRLAKFPEEIQIAVQDAGAAKGPRVRNCLPHRSSRWTWIRTPPRTSASPGIASLIKVSDADQRSPAETGRARSRRLRKKLPAPLNGRRGRSATGITG